MKKLFALFMSLILAFACEEEKPVQEALITLDSEQETSISVPSDGETFDVSFTSALDWTAEIVYVSGGEGWASLNLTSGKGGYSIARLKVNVQKNGESDPRSAKVVITSGAKNAEVSFTQDGDKGFLPGPNPDLVFRLTEKSAEVPAEGAVVEVTVEYNVDYYCEVPVDWIKEVESKAYDTKVHVFEVMPNDSEEPRNTSISFCGNGTCIPFTIEQAGCEPKPEDPVFELSAQSVVADAEGGMAEVTVISNVEYKYEVTVDWIKEVTTKAADEYVHTFEVLPNGSVEERSTVISFCGNDNCLPFRITQKGQSSDSWLEVDVKSISVEASGTESPLKVNVTSNVQWSVATDADWCDVSPTSGENDGSFEVSISESTSSSPRMAKITVSSSDEVASREISVIQAPVSSGTDDDSWINEEFVHRSLMMRFTADWCGYCPIMAEAVHMAQDAYPDKIESLSVHGDGSGLASKASEALVRHYGIEGFPTGLVDGRTQIQNNEPSLTAEMIINAVNETEAKYKTLTGAGWTSSVNGSQIVLNLSLYMKKSGFYKVTALLVEDGIIGYQADYTNGPSENYEHSGVIRSAFTEATGDEFTQLEEGQKKDFNYSVNIPYGCNKDNLKIVVYVQKRENGSFYVDNAASAAVGATKMLAVKSGNWGSGNEGIAPGDDIIL